MSAAGFDDCSAVEMKCGKDGTALFGGDGAFTRGGAEGGSGHVVRVTCRRRNSDVGTLSVPLLRGSFATVPTALANKSVLQLTDPSMGAAAGSELSPGGGGGYYGGGAGLWYAGLGVGGGGGGSGYVCSYNVTEVRTAMKKFRIGLLRFGTGRQKMVLGRWTNPKLSRRNVQPSVQTNQS